MSNPTECRTRREGLTDTDERVYAAMQQLASYRDKLCFGSHDSIGRIAGCSRRTVIRSQQRLERAGVINRAPQTLPSGRRWRCVVWQLPREPRVTQRTTCRRTTTKTTTPFGCRRGRRRRLLTNPEQPQDLVVRKSGPPTPVNSADILATLIDSFKTHNIPLSSRYKGIIATRAKQLLEDGFDHQTITIAAAIAIRRGQPHLIEHITQDLVLAREGHLLTREQYQQQLQDEIELGRNR